MRIIDSRQSMNTSNAARDCTFIPKGATPNRLDVFKNGQWQTIYGYEDPTAKERVLQEVRTSRFTGTREQLEFLMWQSEALRKRNSQTK
jgi:hypothetical protein